MAGSSPRCYCSFAYSALASFRMGMSGSASFQSEIKSVNPIRTSLLRQPHLPHQFSKSWVGTNGVECEVSLQLHQPPVTLLKRSV